MTFNLFVQVIMAHGKTVLLNLLQTSVDIVVFEENPGRGINNVIISLIEEEMQCHNTH